MKHNFINGEEYFNILFCIIIVGQEIINEKNIPNVAIRSESLVYFFIFLLLIISMIKSKAIIYIIGPSIITNMSNFIGLL